ncbi:MAG: hypothetical protein WB680_01965 [Candidatus Acidiferrales bacterium]
MNRSRLIFNFLIAAFLLPIASFAAPRFMDGAWSAARTGLSGGQSSQQAATQKSSGQAPAQSPANTTAPAPSDSAMHSITLTFDYDFTKTPACSATVKTQCVAKFSVYDISSHKPYFLFYAPVPSGAHGLMKGITATSPQLLFAVGKHRIAVSAQEPDGKESPPHECKTIIEIKAAGTADSSTAH